MAEFTYNNAKNTSSSHTPFKLNCSYHSKVLFEEDVNSHSRSRLTDELAEELRELMEVCCQNLLHAQMLKKRVYDKGIKSRSYALVENIWLNNKYIKTMRNKKLDNKFFGCFRVFYTIEKQA